MVDPERYPHMKSVRNCFIRGSVARARERAHARTRACSCRLRRPTLDAGPPLPRARSSRPCPRTRAPAQVRFVQLPAGSVDVQTLHDATRREARAPSKA